MFTWGQLLRRLFASRTPRTARQRVRPMLARLEDRITPVTDQLGYFFEGAWTHQTLGTPQFGFEGAIPVVGDWNGSGNDKIGVYVNGTWFLDWNGNGVWDGATVDRKFQFGTADTLPVVGDWNGDGRDQIGVYQNGTWRLDWNGNGVWNGEQIDRRFQFGFAGALPVVGDWNGNGKDQLGVYHNGDWYLDWNNNRIWEGAAVDRLFHFGFAGAVPVVGDWNGNGKDQLGVYHDGDWYLDTKNNRVWDGPSVDTKVKLGFEGAIPIVGKGAGFATAVNDTFTTAEDQTLTVPAPGVLANDRGADGSSLPTGAKAQLVSGPANGTLQLNANGSFTYTPDADFNGVDTFTYRVVAGDFTSNVATVSIQVGSVNDAPVAVDDAFSTDEDVPLTLTQADLKGNDTDVDNTNAELTVTAVSNAVNGTVVLNGDGTVTFTPAADFNGAAGFDYTVSDGSLSDTGHVTVTVTAVNDAPVVNEAAFAVDENAPQGTVVGTVTFTDPDAGQTHTFAITGGNTGGAFAIDANTGQITVANSAALDFETTSGFTLTVEVTDNGTPVLSGSATITINLNDVNEAPVVDAATFDVDENSTAGTTVGTVTFTDPDAGQTHTFAITGGNTDGAFAIDATGEITVANSAALDFETNPTFALTVEVTDDGTPAGSGTATITINLNDVVE